MRRLFLAAALLALGGCHREPTFDERYEAARSQIDEKAREIDAQATGTAVPSTVDEDDADAK